MKEAWSAAGFWALGDKKYKFYDDKSLLALHLPFSDLEEPMEHPEVLMAWGVELCDYLERCGYKHTKAHDEILDMAFLRDKYGHNAFVMYKRTGRELMAPKVDTQK